MKTTIHKADSREYSLNSWLHSFHTFSFDKYYDPERIRFGALRVLNDDRVGAGGGFGMHPHRDMEIVSIPLEGALTHEDSQGNKETIVPGQIQTMSAGTGILHSEMNASDKEEVKFLQIWILPRRAGLTPLYQVYDIRPNLKENELALIVAPGSIVPATLQQNAWFSMGTIDENKHISYALYEKGYGVYVFVIEGEIKIDDKVLSVRDGMEITETDTIKIETVRKSQLLLIEVPLLRNEG